MKLPFDFFFLLSKDRARYFFHLVLLSRNGKKKCSMESKHALKKLLCKSFKINAQTNPMLPEIDLLLTVHDTLSWRAEAGLLTTFPLAVIHSSGHMETGEAARVGSYLF